MCVHRREPDKVFSVIDFAGDVLTVITALWLYDRIKDWKLRRRYHG